MNASSGLLTTSLLSMLCLVYVLLLLQWNIRQTTSWIQTNSSRAQLYRLRPLLVTNNAENNNIPTKVVLGPDHSTKPDYENIHGPLGKFMDSIFLSVFRKQLAKHVGVDSKLPKDDYMGIIELTAALNAQYSDRNQIQNVAKATLFSLFPSWLPRQFAILFAKPFPKFSSRMNAWATKAAGTWLMGECEINDVVSEDGKVLEGQGLLVKRCRFLEESGCASICVNSCKIPTQNFFLQDMGLPLTMTPDYETHECQFSFGLLPTEHGEAEARNTPCLSRCPTFGSLKKWHTGELTALNSTEESNVCVYMETTTQSM